MKVIRGLNNIDKIPKGSVCTIGVFDGIHLGHLKILNKVIRKAKKEKLFSLVITFHPHPLKLLKPRQEIPLLISLKHRLLIMERLGIDYCFIINFNKKFSKMSPLYFLKNILSQRLKVKILFLGENFRFGRGQEGDVNLLKKMSKEFGIELVIISPIKHRNKIISSSWIREELRLGNLNLVSYLLGRPYSIYGRVIKGEGRGKSLGFPTANLNIEHEALPPCGVYLAKTHLKEEIYPSLLYIGKRPTFSKKSDYNVEVYLLDFKDNLYGKYLEVEIIKKIRPEKKFDKISSLVSAIEKDVRFARQFFS